MSDTDLLALMGWTQVASSGGLLSLTVWLCWDTVRDWLAVSSAQDSRPAVSEQVRGAVILAAFRLVCALVFLAIGVTMVKSGGLVIGRWPARALVVALTWIELAKVFTDRWTQYRVRQSFDAMPEQLMIPHVLDAMPDAVVVVDQDGTIVMVNKQSELLFGHHRGVLVGEPVEMLLPEVLRPAHLLHRQAYLHDPSVRPMGVGRVVQGRRRDGTSVTLEIRLSPMMTSHGLYVVAVARRPLDEAS